MSNRVSSYYTGDEFAASVNIYADGCRESKVHASLEAGEYQVELH